MRRNHRRTQPDGNTVAVPNYMTGRVTATHRNRITVDLDTAHRQAGGPTRVTLPTGNIGTHVDHGWDPTQRHARDQP